MTWRDEIRDSDRPSPRHSRLPTLRMERPWHRDAVPVDLRAEWTELKAPSMEMPAQPRTAREQEMREEPTDSLREWEWDRDAPMPVREQPTGLRTPGTATETEMQKGTGLRREPLAAPPPRWVAARDAL